MILEHAEHISHNSRMILGLITQLQSIKPKATDIKHPDQPRAILGTENSFPCPTMVAKPTKPAEAAPPTDKRHGTRRRTFFAAKAAPMVFCAVGSKWSFTNLRTGRQQPTLSASSIWASTSSIPRLQAGRQPTFAAFHQRCQPELSIVGVPTTGNGCFASPVPSFLVGIIEPRPA